jgi:hypothetical protein
MTSKKTWKLVNGDDSVEEFIDIRRKVGNQIIRAYLLDRLIEEEKIDRVPGRLRGPKDEFKDFDKFLILQIREGERTCRVLAESGVYENLRIVGTDSKSLADESPEAITKRFTDALQEPSNYDAKLIISKKSKVG